MMKSAQNQNWSKEYYRRTTVFCVIALLFMIWVCYMLWIQQGPSPEFKKEIRGRAYTLCLAGKDVKTYSSICEEMADALVYDGDKPSGSTHSTKKWTTAEKEFKDTITKEKLNESIQNIWPGL